MCDLFVRYISKFRAMVAKGSVKSAMKTMGPAKTKLTPPEQYLKKHSKEPKLPGCSQEFQRTCTMRKPAVPARTYKPSVSVYTKRDCIQTKTLKTPQLTYVDSFNGHKEPLENSGLVPKYINKKVEMHVAETNPLDEMIQL